MQSRANLVGFLCADDERRSEQDVVTAVPVDAPLSGINENVLIEGGLPDALSNVFFARKWLARGFVFHEFDAQQQAETADFAHIGMRQKRF